MVLETGSTVTTDGCGHQVAVAEAVVGPAEEGDEEVLTLAHGVAQDVGGIAELVGLGSGVVVEVLPGITGHDVEVAVAYGLVVVGIELEGGVHTAVAVVGVGTAAALGGAVEGLLGALCHLGDTGRLGPVHTQVQVQTEVFEAVHLIVELCVADEAVCTCVVLLFIQGCHRVGGCHGIHVAVCHSPDAVAVQAGCAVVENGLG